MENQYSIHQQYQHHFKIIEEQVYLKINFRFQYD